MYFDRIEHTIGLLHKIKFYGKMFKLSFFPFFFSTIALPEIWRSARGNEKSKKKKKIHIYMICILYVYMNNVYNLF